MSRPRQAKDSVFYSNKSYRAIIFTSYSTLGGPGGKARIAPMASIYDRIGIKIREERKRRHLSLEELAERASLTSSFLGHIERGERKLSVAALEQIASALDLPLGALAGGTPAKRTISWEDRIAGLLRNQSDHRKALVFKTLKAILRDLR